MLFLAHKGSIDKCTRQILGKAPRPRPAFRKLVEQVPFAAVGCMAEDGKVKGEWELVSPGIQPFSHKSSKM